MTLIRPVGLSTLKDYPQGCDSLLFSSPMWQDGKAASCWQKARLPSIHLFSPPCCTWEHWTLFFFPQVGRLEMGFNFWNSFLAPVPKPKDCCGVYQGVSYWRLVPKTNGRRDMTLCFIAVNAWAHVTSEPSRKVGESWLFLAVLPLIDISYNEVLLPQLLNESTSSRVWNLREETLTQELNSPNIIKRCTIFWGYQL